MKTYKVEIIETLSRVVEQDAETYEDAEAGAKEKYLNLGFYDYISKPIQKDILHNVLEKIKNN